MAGRQEAVGSCWGVGPVEEWEAVPGGADLHLSQSLAETTGNWAEGRSPGRENKINTKKQRKPTQKSLSFSFLLSCLYVGYLLHCRTGRLSVAIVTTLAVLLHLPRVHV